MTAPNFRSVDQQTGDVDRPSAFFAALNEPPPVDRATHDAVCAQRDRFAIELGDAGAELLGAMQSLRDLGSLVANLTSQTAMWHAARDEQRERADEWRDKAEAYLATIDDLEGDVRSLTSALGEVAGKLAAAESERDTANARAAVL